MWAILIMPGVVALAVLILVLTSRPVQEAFREVFDRTHRSALAGSGGSRPFRAAASATGEATGSGSTSSLPIKVTISNGGGATGPRSSVPPVWSFPKRCRSPKCISQMRGGYPKLP
jgi:hypothetical protein